MAADGARPSASEAASPLEVCAGLVFREGSLLITQRPAGSHLGGLWEFPGGKQHADESDRDCLMRELNEELGIEVAVGRLVETITHAYPERLVRLKFFQCRWLRHEPQALGCQQFAWIGPASLGGYAFPDADARLLERLATENELWR